MKGTTSNGIDVSLLDTCSNQEEADTLLVFQALHVFQIAGKITIMTLFLNIALHNYPLLRLKDFHQLCARSKRDVYLEPIHILLSCLQNCTYLFVQFSWAADVTKLHLQMFKKNESALE